MARPSGRRTAQFRLPQGQPQPSVPSVMNSFVGGLKTEFTGLNFPENSCTDTQNCTFFRTGSITRRNGFDYELNATTSAIGVSNVAISSFIWTNAGGDGATKVYVLQIGGTLYFYQLSNSTIAAPMSTTKLSSTVTLSTFQVSGAPSPNTVECQFSAGNGYLFVYNQNCDPFYCTFTSGTITATLIIIQIRDFTGIVEPAVPDNFRPNTLSAEHQYNLYNQGWSNQPAWSTTSTTGLTLGTFPFAVTLTVASGLTISGGDPVTAYVTASLGGRTVPAGFNGTVTGYSGTTLTLNLTSGSNGLSGWTATGVWSISKASQGLINTFVSANNLYPSNADQWFSFKDSSDVFNPAVTTSNVQLGTGPAPKGSFILNAFRQQRTLSSSISGLTDVITNARPTTGTWFQGRVWYSGVNASQAATGDAQYYTWTENIYFSQIITKVTQFGYCYQTNDPTSETLDTVLPSDGGVIVIQGSGPVYKLFPVQNGLLVFAANGIWFITGGSGIGFTAIDYTINKISGVQNISGTSIIDVQGLPIFWNGDGIYMITTSQQNAEASLGFAHTGFNVERLSLPTIQSFFNNIPTDSKKYARGDYNPLTGQVQWVYRSTQEAGISNRYKFDTILNFSLFTQAFYPWTISPGPTIVDAKFITYTQTNSPPSLFKYATINGTAVTFSEERENVIFEDWIAAGTPVNYTSYFVTAYQLKGQAQRKFQPQYIYIYSEAPTSGYTLQGIWDFALNNLSNRFSPIQIFNNNKPNYGKTIRKHRIRGNGYVLQYKISSTDGQPFNISGWSVVDVIGIQ